jgi:polyisoprenoid-binding protein YceI
MMRILLLLLLLPSLMVAQTKKPFDKKNSFVSYGMNHLLHSWVGTSKDLNGVAQIGSNGKLEKVAILSKVSAFDSENSNRDAHMLEVVESLKYPNISFYSTSISESKPGELEVKGILQFHGVNKETSFKASIASKGATSTVKGEFIFLLEDYKIERPSFMLNKVDNEVKVNFEVSY